MSAPAAPTRPPQSGSNAWWTLMSGLGGVLAGSVLVLFVAVNVAARVTGHRGPGFFEVLQSLGERPGDPVGALAGPVGPAWLSYVLFAMVLAVIATAVVLVVVRYARRSRRAGSGALAPAAELAPIQERAALDKARQVAPANAKDLTAKELLVPLGHVGSRRIYLQHELSVLVLAPSRSGKTTNCVVGWVLDAPGSVIVTSTKNDVAHITIMARQLVGRVYVHDLRDATGWPEKVHWHLTRGCEDAAEAIARADAMAAGAPSGGATNGDWFNRLAARTLRYLLHAAALKPGGDASDVVRWAADLEDPEPVTILRDRATRTVIDREGVTHDTRRWADLLHAQAQGNASDQTTGSMQSTLLGILEPLDDPAVLAACCPRPGAPAFDREPFLTERSTLYVVSKATRATTAPIVTAFLDWILRGAEELAEQSAGGRLWPPLSVVGDEIANIAPLPNIDTLVSDSGGRGISLRLIAQTKAQLVKRWGRENAEAIFVGVNATLALPGVREPDVLRELSFLTGPHRVARVSVTSSESGTSSTTSGERENRMREDQIREMPLGTALLVMTNMPAAHIQLTRWMDRADADQLREDLRRVEQITGRAAEE